LSEMRNGFAILVIELFGIFATGSTHYDWGSKLKDRGCVVRPAAAVGIVDAAGIGSRFKKGDVLRLVCGTAAVRGQSLA